MRVLGSLCRTAADSERPKGFEARAPVEISAARPYSIVNEWVYPSLIRYIIARRQLCPTNDGIAITSTFELFVVIFGVFARICCRRLELNFLFTALFRVSSTDLINYRVPCRFIAASESRVTEEPFACANCARKENHYKRFSRRLSNEDRRNQD